MHVEGDLALQRHAHSRGPRRHAAAQSRSGPERRRAISRTPTSWARHKATSSRSAEDRYRPDTVAGQPRVHAARVAEPPERVRRGHARLCRRILGLHPPSNRRPEPDPILSPGHRRPPRRGNLAPVLTDLLLPLDNTHAPPPLTRCCDDQLKSAHVVGHSLPAQFHTGEQGCEADGVGS
jgi:hypothetical protein